MQLSSPLRGLCFFSACALLLASCTKTAPLRLPAVKTSNSTAEIPLTGDAADAANNTVSIEGKQIPNSDFELWYSSNCYNEPGASANDKNKYWATGNAGYKKGGGGCAGNMTTDRISGDGSNGAARLITREVVPGRAVGKGIAAGSLFVGSFYVNPRAPTIPGNNDIRPFFGIGFTGMPIAFSFKYKYKSGGSPKNGLGGGTRGTDALDAYVILENRDQSPHRRLAVGWFRDRNNQATWKEQRVDINYSFYGSYPIEIGDPDGANSHQFLVLKYGPEGNTSASASRQKKVVWGDTTNVKPTHIVVVFSSSYGGDDFLGAPGSELSVDDFKLIYKEEDSETATDEGTDNTTASPN